MFLDEYLFYKKMKKKDFAKKLGVAYPYFLMVSNKKFPCSMKIAKKIEELTEGKVTAQEMIFPQDYEKNRLKI